MLKCHQVIIHAFHVFCPVTVCIRILGKRLTLKAKLLADLRKLIAATVDIILFDLLFLTGNTLLLPVLTITGTFLTVFTVISLANWSKQLVHVIGFIEEPGSQLFHLI